MRRKLLLATTNEEKLREMKKFLETLPFDLVSLSDVGITEEPQEPFDTVEMNAAHKAEYYATKSGLLTLSDDSGFFIEALGGWPGVKAARVAPTVEERRKVVLQKLEGEHKRNAYYLTAQALYDPSEKVQFIATGRVDFVVGTEVVTGERNFGYDPIMFDEASQKMFSQMSVEEKNAMSSRGKALQKMEYFLKKQYGARHIVVPCGFLIQNGKLYLQKRNDPFRPDYHAKWEFPGGGVEFGEQMQKNVIREVKEETGFEVEVVHLLQHIQVEAQEYPNFSYQVYLVPYVCKVVGGKFVARDHEVMEGKWFDLDEVPTLPLVGNDKEFYAKVIDELKKIVQENNL